MVVESFQNLVDEIILNGVSISALSYIYIALVAFISSSLGTYFASYLKKQGEEKSLQTSFKDVIQRLEQTTKLTEEIKSGLGRATLEHQIKFTKLHDKRIDVIEKLYHKLENMEQMGREFIHDSRPSGELGEKFKDAQNSINDFISYSKLNKFWVDKELYEEIEKIALLIDRTVHENVYACGIGDIGPDNWGAFEKAMEQRKISVQKITKDIPEAKNLLISRIRTTLDPNEN